VEIKGWTTLGISIALIVAAASALFSYQQYQLNAARDQREQALFWESRTPIIVVQPPLRLTPKREFALRLLIRNTELARAEIYSIELTEPNDFELLIVAIVPKKDACCLWGPPTYDKESPKAIMLNGPLEPRAKMELSGLLKVPELAVLPAILVLKFRIKLVDNKDTTIYVNRTVELSD
jgi:hypothetical protein